MPLRMTRHPTKLACMYLPVHPNMNADVIRLDDGTVRLQSPSGNYCTLNGADDEIVNLLGQLNGLHDLNALVANLEPTRRPDARLLLAELVEHDMICEATAPRQFVIQLVGRGRLARAASLALLDDPRNHLLLTPAARGAKTPNGREWLFGPPSKTQRFVAANRVATGVHWSAIASDSADLVLVCPSSIEVDQAIVAHLLHIQIPHLVLGAHRDTARIGPLVDGYGGSCATCGNQHLGARDPAWLSTLAELAMSPASPNELLLRWVGAEAALRVSWFMDGNNTLRSTVLEATTGTPGVVARTITRNPDCACQQRNFGRPKLRLVRSTPTLMITREDESLPMAA
jgi:hypothetical protein